MAPAAEYRGGRFSDTDNVTYHSIRHPADLVWQEKSHFSPKEVVLPITQTLFHFDNLELRESKVEAKPTLLFLRSCDIHALRRLDQVYLKNGQNSDVYYARLRSKLKLVLLECRESFENCFCVSMGSNETRDYAAAIRLSDEGARIEVKDPELLGKALMGDDGLLKRMSNALDPYTKRDGALKGRKTGLEANEKRINERMEALDRRMDSAYKRYLNQFTTMNQMLQTMGAL